MKVRTLKAMLDGLRDDDDICALMWDKSCFDYSENDGVTLTEENWALVCQEFEREDFIDIGEWIADQVVRLVELKVPAQ